MDLKSFREDKLKIKTQSEFAELLGVDQSNISRWEKDPDSITYPIIQKILEKTGAKPEELLGWKRPIPEPLDVKDTWEKADFTKHTLSEYISNVLDKADIPDDLRKNYIDDLNKGISENLIKPKVAIVGRSDTGKSTLINALLGTDKMPTSWTPTTSIAVYIKHISDKPSFIEEDTWIFSNHSNEYSDETFWNERKLYDEEYCRSWKMSAGGVEVLQSFGTRQGENYDKEAGAAVVFIDAPILKNCDIIDLPGFGTETNKDDEITFSVSQRADIIIYLSQANGFMRIEDITYLKRNIPGLPIWEKKDENNLSPLSNLFIVASQAHAVNNGNRVQLKTILDTGCQNLVKTLPDGFWDDRQTTSGFTYANNGLAELRSRLFAYSVDIPDLCAPFNDALSQILETLPIIINDKAIAFVRHYIELRRPILTNEIQKYEGILEERERYKSLLEEIEKNEVTRVKENDARKESVRNKIKYLREESINEFSDYFSKVVNIDSLIALMHEKGVRNKKEDVELFGSTLQSMLQFQCEKILKDKSEILSQKAQAYITEYTESISRPFANKRIDIDFDAGWAFASALSNIGMIGGLSAFVVGAFFLLASISLSLSAALILAGPIGLVVGLLIAGGLGIVKLFGGGWEKTVAKKIVATIEENGVLDKFIDCIKNYWDETESAFNQAAQKLDEEWNAYVENLREIINGYDIHEIQNKIITLKNLAEFFDSIPL